MFIVAYKILLMSLFSGALNSSLTLDIDHRSRLGSARDQGGTGLCASVAVADAVSMNTKEPVGALSLAFQYYKYRQGRLESFVLNPLTNGAFETYQGGIASTVLESSLKSTLCPKSSERMPENDNPEALSHLVSAYKVYRSTLSVKYPEQTVDVFVSQLAGLFMNLDVSQVHRFMSLFKPLDDVLGEWIDNSCNIIISSGFKVTGSSWRPQSKKMKLNYINKALESGQIAIVHFNLSFLQFSRFEDQVSRYKTVVIEKKEIHPVKGAQKILSYNLVSLFEYVGKLHVSSVVGRRWTQSGTEYLLRNSWGATCTPYIEKFRDRCEQGHIWLTEKQILKMVYSVTFLSRI